MARKDAGCAGIGCLGFGVVLLGFCGSLTDPPPSAPLLSSGGYEAPTASPPAPPSETFYIHGQLNVRSGPGKQHPTLRTLSRGAAVQLGPADANGWAELYAFGGTREGYIYRASDLVRGTPPPDDKRAEGSKSSGSPSTPQRARSSGRSSAGSNGYHTGPRGGCYTYSASGRKRYVDRSYCN